MKNSIEQLFLEVVNENNIDLNSKYKLEKNLCIDKIIEKLDMRGKTQIQSQLLVYEILWYVDIMFKYPNRRPASLSK